MNVYGEIHVSWMFYASESKHFKAGSFVSFMNFATSFRNLISTSV